MNNNNSLREDFDKAFLSWNGFHTKAELDAEWAEGSLSGEMFRAGASRQVANKAEVEPAPFGYVKFCAAQRITTEGDVDANEWYEFCEQEDIGDDKMPAFPLYAAPPAATGASTVLTDERENCQNCYADREDSIGCADCDGTGTIAREVAAQAGQVAATDMPNGGMHDSVFVKVWGDAGGGDAGRRALANYAYQLGKRDAP